MGAIQDLKKIKNEILKTDNLQDQSRHLYFIKELVSFCNLNDLDSGIHHDSIKLNSLLSRYSDSLQNDDAVFFLKYQKTDGLIKEYAFGDEKIINKDVDTSGWRYEGYRYFNNAGQHTKAIQESLLEIEIPENIKVHIDHQWGISNLEIPSGKYIVKIQGSSSSSAYSGISCIDKDTGESLRYGGLKVRFAVNGYYKGREIKNPEFISSVDEYFDDPDLFAFEMNIDDDWINKLIFQYRNRDIEEVIQQNLKPWETSNEDSILSILNSKKSNRTIKEKMNALFSKQYLSNEEKVDIGIVDKNLICYFRGLDLETALNILSHPRNHGSNGCYREISYNIDNKEDLDVLLQLHLNNCKEIKLGVYGLNFYGTYGHKYSKKVVDEGLMMAIKSFPNNLCQIKGYQTEELCIEAVKLLGSSLRYVEDKTLNVCLEAVKNNPKSLKHVPEEHQELAKKEIENLKQKKKKPSKNKI